VNAAGWDVDDSARDVNAAGWDVDDSARDVDAAGWDVDVPVPDVMDPARDTLTAQSALSSAALALHTPRMGTLYYDPSASLR
jgi:hypothetical protein